MYSRTVSYSRTITRYKTASLNAQILGTLPRVWSLVKSAVSNPLSRSRAFGLGLQTCGLHLGCGDVADITTNSGTTAPESDCTMPCTGDSLHLCGDNFRLQLYLWKGTLNTWDTPTNMGRYEVFPFSMPV